MKTTLAALGATALLAFSTQAHAAYVTVDYRGLVDARDANGFPTIDLDSAGLFGGGNLEGYGLEALLTYDTSIGSVQTDGSTYQQRVGGSDYGVASPILSAAFTINGHTYNIDTRSFYQTSVESDVTLDPTTPGFVQQIGSALDGTDFLLYLNSFKAPRDLGTSFADTGSGAGYLLTGFQSNGAYDSISFDLTSVAVSAAPEPGVWVLLLSAIGLTGSILRRRLRRPGGTLQSA